ncbi:hypothetical protein FHT87_005878 [Rhizobium sp. BK316]|uniref:hypothetical protein n=1 Tax=Rhizobium sp. BK316 TaxID=2587053 RepID=UPI001617C467|nr:hypothetical protein [Rhizobium sp. BK316]MBB3411911.1 hypothetical protein [Rhizobium sp. BK316]
MNSYQELNSFISFWQKSPTNPRRNAGNTTIIYPVSLIYESQDRSVKMAVTTELTAYIGSGPDDGKLSLKETDELTSDSYHLDFLARFQRFKFVSSSSSLEVTGNSSKMGGDYLVTITPTLQKP